MKLFVCATWPGCPKAEGTDHLAELMVLEGTPKQLNQAMNSPINLWKKRQFVCGRCGETAIVPPVATYISGNEGENQNG